MEITIQNTEEKHPIEEERNYCTLRPDKVEDVSDINDTVEVTIQNTEKSFQVRNKQRIMNSNLIILQTANNIVKTNIKGEPKPENDADENTEHKKQIKDGTASVCCC